MDRPDTDSPTSAAAMQAIASLGQNDATLVARAHGLNATVMLGIGEHPWRMRISRGRLEQVEPGPFVMPGSSFRLATSELEWRRFWQPVPPPGSHDLFALLKRGVLQLDGDLHPFMAHLLYFKLLLAAPRSMR